MGTLKWASLFFGAKCSPNGGCEFIYRGRRFGQLLSQSWHLKIKRLTIIINDIRITMMGFQWGRMTVEGGNKIQEV